MKIPESLAISDHTSLSLINTIRDSVNKIWAIPLHPYYTNHNVNHSDKIVTLVGKLLESTDSHLNETERFILLAAIYLHDIGMQSPLHAGLEKKRDYSFKELEKIRDVHNVSSEKMIFDSLSPHSELNFGLRGSNPAIVRMIGLVAKCHRKYDLSTLKDTVINIEKIRIPLLAALMRLGDELDIDYQRVSIDMLSVINISTIEKFHWYSHLYVQGLDISEGKIFIYFCLPETYRDNQLPSPLVNKSKLAIKDNISELFDIFYKYKLLLPREVHEIIEYSETQKILPDDLLDYIAVTYDVQLDDKRDVQGGKNIIFNYYFIPPGSIVSDDAEDERKRIKKNRVFLDVGNKIEKGVIDTHILRKGMNNNLSTVGGIISSPNFIIDNITPNASEIEIVVHSDPDFDCFASVYLVKELILNKILPDGYQELFQYVEAVDMGRTIIDTNYYYTPNIIARAISGVITNENPNLPKYLIDLETLSRGVGLIKYLMEQLNKLVGNKSFYNLSILSKGSPFDKEYKYLDGDYKKYKHELTSTFINEKGEELPSAERIEIALPMKMNYMEKQFVSGIIWNKIPDCVLHKDWARADEDAPGGEGYIFTFIPVSRQILTTEKNIILKVNRVIIAVQANSTVSLKGLGEILEKAEVKKEIKIFGDDVSVWRSRTVVRKSIEYADNEDPWYDGRGHEYTIVDSPGRYSLLSIDEIKQVLREYADIKFLIDYH